MWYIFYNSRLVIVECSHFVEARVLMWVLCWYIVAAAMEQTMPTKTIKYIVLGTCLRHACVLCIILCRQGSKLKFTKCFLQSCNKNGYLLCYVLPLFNTTCAAYLLYHQEVALVFWKALDAGFSRHLLSVIDFCPILYK